MRPLKFQGKKLVLNYAAKSGGSVRVELQDAEGKPRPYSSANAVLSGDSLRKTVTWGEQPDLSPLVGQSVRIRFILKDAKLFSFRFE